MKPNGAVCRASADSCDTDETCSGSVKTCPADAHKPDNSACDDGNKCTQTDTCLSGLCTGAGPVVCKAQDGCHDVGVCDTSTGLCSNPVKPDNMACDDGDKCTQTDACLAGVCTGANPVVCQPIDECFEAGTCNPVDGKCTTPAKPYGTPCSKGICQAGVCVPAPDGGIDADAAPDAEEGGDAVGADALESGGDAAAEGDADAAADAVAKPDADSGGSDAVADAAKDAPGAEAGQDVAQTDSAADAQPAGDGSAGAAPAAPAPAAAEESGGCGCRVPGGTSRGSTALLVLGLAVLAAGRRRRARRHGR
jgi:MYXO-CTERM domain-containing protein